jgi:hypothetical protein
MTKPALIFQRGASTVLFALALTTLLGLGAFAIDLNNVILAHTELKNAADAGALEGARVLYCSDGSINHQADQCGPGLLSADEAAAAASLANDSQGDSVEVVRVERGHWEFRSDLPVDPPGSGIRRGGTFTSNSSTMPASTVDADGDFRSFLDLNGDTSEINAVRVVTARETNPIQSFFARVLGISSLSARATSVAYLGFAATINPAEIDAPIAVCEHLLMQDGEYNCKIGRWNTSSPGDEGAAKWTDFNQSSCNAASKTEVGNLIDAMSCGADAGINPETLYVSVPVSVTGEGVVQSNLSTLFEEWKNCLPSRTCSNGSTSEFPTQPWSLRLPVVDCDDADNSSCNPLFGAVEVQVIWFNNQNSDSGFPACMEGVDGFDDWAADSPDSRNRWNDPIEVPNTRVYPPGATGDDIIYDVGEYDLEEQLWDSFVRHFRLSRNTTQDCSDGAHDCGWWKGDIKNPFADNDSGYRDKAIYFSPSCEGLSLGNTGGSIPFLRAATPVLVY